MVNDNTPNHDAGSGTDFDRDAEQGAQGNNPKRSLTGQIRNEAIVQSANLFLVARRILTTSLGAIALSIEETNEFIERLVERGEVAEHELGALIDEISGQISARSKGLVQRRPELSAPADEPVPPEKPLAKVAVAPEATVAADRLPSLLGDRVESILGRLNVPTRNDIESITSKIEILSGKVMLLKSKSTRAPDSEATYAPEVVETEEV